MIETINFILKAKSPIHVGGDSLSTIRLPYLLHIPIEQNNDEKINKVNIEHLKEFIRIVGAFYRNTKHNSYGYRSYGDIFKDRVYVCLLTNTISSFFTALVKKIDLSSQDVYQYMTKFALKLSRIENMALLQWARENIDIFITSAIFCENSSMFKDEFVIHEDLCNVEIDAQIPVIPGNSLRGHARNCLMNYIFIFLYGLKYQTIIKDTIYYTFFNGGQLTSSDGFINIEEKALLRQNLPFLSIFGAMLGKEDLSGKMNIGFGYLNCNETNKENNRDGMSYLKEYFMTRRDSFEGMVDEETKEKMSSAIQMIYSCVCIEKNTTFFWSVDKKYMTEIESSFFDLMLRELIKDGKIGGNARSGFGEIEYKTDYQLKPELAEKFLVEKKEDILNYIKGM